MAQFNTLSSFLDDLLHMFEQNPHGLDLDSELVAYFQEALREAVGLARSLELTTASLEDILSPRPVPLPTTRALRRERALVSMEIPGTSVVVLPFGGLPPKPTITDGHDRGGAA